MVDNFKHRVDSFQFSAFRIFVFKLSIDIEFLHRNFECELSARCDTFHRTRTLRCARQSIVASLCFIFDHKLAQHVRITKNDSRRAKIVRSVHMRSKYQTDRAICTRASARFAKLFPISSKPFFQPRSDTSFDRRPRNIWLPVRWIFDARQIGPADLQDIF